MTGIVVLRDLRPGEGTPEYLFQEAAAGATSAAPAPRGAAPAVQAPAAPSAAEEPQPPAPFEYIPS